MTCSESPFLRSPLIAVLKMGCQEARLEAGNVAKLHGNPPSPQPPAPVSKCLQHQTGGSPTVSPFSSQGHKKPEKPRPLIGKPRKSNGDRLQNSAQEEGSGHLWSL